MKDPAVNFDDVTFFYEDTPVLKDVNFSIEEGSFVGMIGPNGGGKTTLLKLLMGFLKPTRGSISIFGNPPSYGKQEIAYVPQSLRYDKQFPISVMELVLGGRLAHLPWYGVFSKEDIEAAIQALERVNMSQFKDRGFGTLSGGQAQRALIARALASNPKLLLLDEPTANVDANAEHDIYDILKKLQGYMTILMVTHDLNTAIHLFDKVLCVQHTCTVLDPQQVCEHFAIGLYHPPLIKNIGGKK